MIKIHSAFPQMEEEDEAETIEAPPPRPAFTKPLKVKPVRPIPPPCTPTETEPKKTDDK